MNDLLTIQNIGYLVGIFGVIFGIYNRYFKDPIDKSATIDAVLSSELKQLKLDILNLKDIITNLKDNHIHSLQTAIEDTNKNLNTLTIQVARMGVIIDERIPRNNLHV